MTRLELAALLNGRSYRNEMTKAEEKAARDAGLVVVFGASDDLIEFRGAISDEGDCYEGGTFSVTRNGLPKSACDQGEECPYFAKLFNDAPKIHADWCADDSASWTYRTDIPHATFDIREDDETYCRGIVFAIESLPA
jgi:hypothetical protein